MDESVYVQFLKWADSKGLQGFSEQEVVDHFGDEIKPVLLSAKKSQALVYADFPGERRQVLSLEGKFKLLGENRYGQALQTLLWTGTSNSSNPSNLFHFSFCPPARNSALR
jgi:hypothetical protein